MKEILLLAAAVALLVIIQRSRIRGLSEQPAKSPLEEAELWSLTGGRWGEPG